MAGGLLAALVLRALRGRVLPYTGITLAGVTAATPILLWSALLADAAGAMILSPLVALAVIPVLLWLAVRRQSGATHPLGTVTGGAVWAVALHLAADLLWTLL